MPTVVRPSKQLLPESTTAGDQEMVQCSGCLLLFSLEMSTEEAMPVFTEFIRKVTLRC